jgi:hypothetical protein
MSNSLAISAATATLQYLLLKGVASDPDLGDVTVTTLPLDKARGTATNNQLNLFLYQILPSAAWRNFDVPRQVQSGETATPPLPLNLFYLLTAFGRDDDATLPFSHQLLGKAMSLLYDHPLLSAADIQSATSASLPRSDLDHQVERVRITLQPLSVEDISKLWTGFATQYRLSAAYEVGVTLVDSTRAAKAPLPVLARGARDSGFASQANVASPFPALDAIAFPNAQTVARLGDTLKLTGSSLDGTGIGVQFNHPLWTTPVEVAPSASPAPTSTQVSVQVPNTPAAWPAGFYTVAVLVQRPGETYRRVTNLLSFALAPTLAIAPASAPAGNILFTVTAAPDALPGQRASLLLGDQEIVADAHSAQTSTLTFEAQSVAAGNYYVRLRIDGVDSILINRAVTPPAFDPTQKVAVT